jgi:hypothetical protein
MKKSKIKFDPPPYKEKRDILYVRGIKPENKNFINDIARDMGYDSVADYLNTLIDQLRERHKGNAA